MRAARPMTLLRSFAALAVAIAILSCGGSDSTGPGGGNGVTVTPNPDTVALGSTITLHATVDGGSGGASFFWSSENTSIATVSGTGVVTGVALGSARIAASSGGKSGVATVVVVPPGVASVVVTPNSAAKKVGETVHFVAQTFDAGGVELTGRTVTWTSEHTDVATIDANGVATALSEGATTITATSEGKSGTAGLAVAAAVPASITVDPPSVSITTGQTAQLTATVKDASGNVISGAPVSWTATSGGVAIVSSTGLVTGQSAGGATVTATSGSVHADVAVTVVLPPASSVIVSPSTVSILISQTQQLTATVTDAGGHPLPGQTVTWQSSNQSVATVNASGLVTGVFFGTATITGTSGAASGESHVTVSLVPVRRVTVTPDALAFTLGDPGTQVVVALLDSIGQALGLTGRPVAWTTSKPSVATVSSTGFVTPTGPGQAVITATQTGSGLSASTSVTVTPVSVASVVVTPTPDTLVPPQAVQLTAKTLDASGNTLTGRTVIWDGSDDNIALVSSTGRVVAQSPGTITVTATSEGKTGTATIVVTAVPVASVTISPTTQSVVAGSATPAFTAVAKDASGNVLSGRTITFASGNTSVATIDANTGVATGVAPGTASITATSEGVISAPATLTVTDVPVSSITIAPTSQSVVVGDQTPAFTAVTKDASGNVLTGRTVTFNSGTPAVATINSNTGVATGVSPGTSSITATSEGKTSTAATLTVTPVPVNNVVVTPPSQSVDVGSTVTFVATPRDASNAPLSGRTIIYSSSDPTIATINSSTGVATGVSPGTVTIGAISEGKTGTASLTVNPAPVSSVTVSPPAQTIDDGNTANFTATLKDAHGNTLSGRVIAWSSSDETVATVDNAGVATSTGPGSTTITATSEGQSGTATLQVDLAPVTSVSVDPPVSIVSIGDEVQFTATVHDSPPHGHMHPVQWSSSDESVASIDDKGKMKALALGLATITATSQGQSGIAAVTILP
jgi:uncharacterized protein YjdB